VSLTIGNARQLTDLNKQKAEFVAENPFDVTAHVVSIEAALGQFELTSHLSIMFL